MEKIDVICPSCKKIRASYVKNETDLSIYSNRYCHKVCPDCKDNPEARLLDAIFGKAPVSCGKDCPFYSMCTVR